MCQKSEYVTNPDPGSIKAYSISLNADLRMLEPWIKNPGGLDADNFIQSGSVVRGTYTYHRNILLLGL